MTQSAKGFLATAKGVFWTVAHPLRALKRYEDALDVIKDQAKEIQELRSKVWRLTSTVAPSQYRPHGNREGVEG